MEHNRQTKDKKRKRIRRAYHEAGRDGRIMRRAGVENPVGHKLLMSMTNWQLTKWNRAGSPGDLQSIKTFKELRK
jgi:hypothetical protein